MKNQIKNQSGQLSLIVLIFSGVAIIILSALIIWVDSAQKTAYRTSDQKQALMVAEAGVEYYRWHLSHVPTDYQDGTGHVGPYVHTYTDKNGDTIGNFSLEITAPTSGNYIVTVKSTGSIAGSNVQKTLEAKLGKPSFIQYAVLSNSNIKFETGTHVVGPIHSNGGIHFDGVSENAVTSARSTYDDPDHAGANEWAIHTHSSPIDPLPPSPLPVRSDVFKAGRRFPVPAVDFSGITENLAQIKTKAMADGKYLAPSGLRGYRIVLKTNGTYDLYKVKQLQPPSKGCRNILHQTGWGTWSVRTKSGSETFVANYALPANGLIFVEDHVWVEGKISNTKLTIASGRFPASASNYSNIIVNHNLTYTNYDGKDAIGLIAQGNVLVGMISDDNLRIDAAVVSQNGQVERFYYRPSVGSKVYCSPYNTRTSFLLNGMIATNNGYGFAYSDGVGYQSRNITYDSNLLYNPPPSFPLVSDFYKQISWQEL